LGVVGSSRDYRDMYGPRVTCGLSPHQQFQEIFQEPLGAYSRIVKLLSR
jgi:hypothetical protein